MEEVIYNMKEQQIGIENKMGVIIGFYKYL